MHRPIGHCALHHWAFKPRVDWLVGATLLGAVLHAAQVSRCGTLFFCSLASLSLLPSAQQTIPGRPEFSQGERTPRTHDLQMPPDRIRSPIPLPSPPELPNNGGELRPRPSCSSASRLSSRLSPDGPWTGHGRERPTVRRGYPVDRCTCFQDRVGRWLAPPSTLDLQPPGAVEPVHVFYLLTAAVDLRKIGVVAS
jgi:hypothetical protein